MYSEKTNAFHRRFDDYWKSWHRTTLGCSVDPLSRPIEQFLSQTTELRHCVTWVFIVVARDTRVVSNGI